VLQRKAALETQDAEFGRGVLARLVHMRVWIVGILAMVAAFIPACHRAQPRRALGGRVRSSPLELPLSLLFASWAFSPSLGRLEWPAPSPSPAAVIVVLTALSPTPGKPPASAT